MTERGVRWLLWDVLPDAEARLFCMPFSGAGGSLLRTWPRRVGPLEVCPVQLPGRENRIRHPLYDDFEACARDVAAALVPYCDRPFALFGHCMGALLAHAVAVVLEDRGHPVPELLVVSSARVPHLPPERRYRTPVPGIRGMYHPSMSDAQFGEEVRAMAGRLGEAEVLPELVPLAVRALRADVTMSYRYAPPSPQPVRCPVTAIGWHDDGDVDPAEMAAWDAYGRVRHHVIGGDKLAFVGAPPALLDVIEGDWRESRARAVRQEA